MSTPSEPTQKDRDAAVDSLNCPPGTSIVTACAQAIATARAEGRAEGVLLGVRAMLREVDATLFGKDLPPDQMHAAMRLLTLDAEAIANKAEGV